MFTGSETTATVLIILVAMGVLGWGFNRARSYGKLGILAWLQSVVLTAPWLLFFGLFTAGIYLNLVGILFLLVASAGLYIFLGKPLRAAGQDAVLQERATKLLNDKQESSDVQKPDEQISATAANLTSPPNGKNPPQAKLFRFPLKTSKVSKGFLASIPSLLRKRFPIRKG
jgi:hypothetical protein